MRLSTKSRFAVNAMIDLTLRQHTGPVSLAAISQRQHISISYLEQIFSKMRQHGLVESTRGPGGGYTLQREPQHISVADIILAVGSAEDDVTALNSDDGNGYVSTDELWSDLNQKIEEHMRGISLHSLVSSQKAKGLQVPTQEIRKSGVFSQKTKASISVNAPNSVFALGRPLVGSY